MRRAHRLVALTLAAGMVGGFVGSAPVAAKEIGGKICGVDHLTKTGAVDRTSAEPEGAQYGPFRCVAGIWAYHGDTVVTADRLTIDAAGMPSVGDFTMSERAHTLTMADLSEIAAFVTGAQDATLDRAVIATRIDRQPTDAEIDAVLAGRDANDIKVLKVLDPRDKATTLGDLADSVKGSGPTVIYLGWLRAAARVLVAAAGVLSDWVIEHCRVDRAPGGFMVVCTV